MQLGTVEEFLASKEAKHAKYLQRRRRNAMKAMKATKKVLQARLQKRHVFAGKMAKTRSGLAKDDLVKNKRGKIVSKKMAAKGNKSPWIAALVAARQALNIKGFAAPKKDSPLYNKAKMLLIEKKISEMKQQNYKLRIQMLTGVSL